MSKYISPYSLALIGSNGADRLAYRDYLQQAEFRQDSRDAQAKVQYAIAKSSRELIATHEQLANRGFEMLGEIQGGLADLDATIQGGFEKLGFEVADLSDAVVGLTAKCEWGFSQTIAGIGRVHVTLQELLTVAKTPAQNWAYNQYEIGRNSMRQHLYPEALKAMLRAVHGFGGETGYELEFRFHYCLGILYLGDVHNTDAGILDLGKAEESFLLAARYARKDFPGEAAVALCAAGWAAYCSDKLSAARQHTQQAIAMDQHGANPKAHYQLAMLCLREGSSGDGIAALRKAITLDPDFMLMAQTEPDMIKHQGILGALFEGMRKEKRSSANEVLNNVTMGRKELADWHPKEGFATEVAKIDESIEALKNEFATGTYFGYLNLIALGPGLQSEMSTLIAKKLAQLKEGERKLCENIRSVRTLMGALAAVFADKEWGKCETEWKQLIGSVNLEPSFASSSQRIDSLDKVLSDYQAARGIIIQRRDQCVAGEARAGFMLGALGGGALGGVVGFIIGFIVAAVVAVIFSLFGNEHSLIPEIILIVCIFLGMIGGGLPAGYAFSEKRREACKEKYPLERQ